MTSSELTQVLADVSGLFGIRCFRDKQIHFKFVDVNFTSPSIYDTTMFLPFLLHPVLMA